MTGSKPKAAARTCACGATIWTAPPPAWPRPPSPSGRPTSSATCTNRSRQRSQLPTDQDDRNNAFKSGSWTDFGDGRRYILHNTLLQATAAGSQFPLGAGGGISAAGSTEPLTNTVSRNNILHIWKSQCAGGNIAERPAEHRERAVTRLFEIPGRNGNARPRFFDSICSAADRGFDSEDSIDGGREIRSDRAGGVDDRCEFGRRLLPSPRFVLLAQVFEMARRCQFCSLSPCSARSISPRAVRVSYQLNGLSNEKKPLP